MLVNNKWATEKIKEEIKKYLETNESGNNDIKPIKCSKSSSKREVYSNSISPQETRKISNKQPNLAHKGTTKEEKTKLRVSRRKELLKIRAEICKIETKKNRKKNQWN